MLNLSNLGSSRSGRLLFDNLSYQLERGEILYVKGSNGAGKTTLLKMICGILKPGTGEILWNGSNIHEAIESYRSNLIYLNHQHAQKDELTVQENLDFSLKISGVFEEDSTVENALNMVGLSAFKSRPFRALSQGQKRRVSLARLAADRSRQLWVLDEPFNTLDQEGISLLEGLVQNHLNAGGVVVLASHLEPKINPRCLKVLMLEK